MPLAHDLTENEFDALLQARDFAQLFNRLGWDNIPKGTPPAVLLTVPARGANTPLLENFVFQLVKEKHGFVVLYCATLPDVAQRRRLSLDMSKQYAEHLLIYAPEAAGAEQLWQLVVRDPGQPVRFFEFWVRAGQVPRDLWNRVEGLAISLADEEKGLTLTQVREKTRRAFALNAEKVTKKFYQEFSRQHKEFQGQIEGIESSTDRAWYASIMLNRIMFIYFVQAQGYLLVDAAGPSGDDDKRYLRHKLDECARLVGKDQFQSFYRDFLRVLFHQGLNAPLPHAPALAKLLGRVPYLNGGLFEEHQLEQANPRLHIPDKAFDKLFVFLSQWDWILDSRQHATGTTINPDVLGYIFEQYINSLERKASGSYYTKEDITDYIAKNCLVPALFDRMAATVSHGDEVWNLLRDYPDSYLYPAQKKGMSHPLLADVEAARTNVAARTPLWNRPTPEPYGLPTELWRETIQRRDRAFAAQARLMSGQVQTINELITLNLDVRQFLHDAIRNAGSAEWVWACFEGLRSLSILDPTCGSGAFLFAALRLLEPLYEECLDRMLTFLPELENAKTLPVKRRVVEGMKKVRQELVEDHQENRAYFITKTIILHNLYGVDLMHEAVEIAKLRLFLQLMSTLPAPDYKDKNMGLEPLPDVDFNIRAGNTLVGFATKKEVDENKHLDIYDNVKDIEKHLPIVAKDYADFVEMQTNKTPGPQLKAAKGRLLTNLGILRDLCDDFARAGRRSNETLEEYRKNQSNPFHWFAEFYEIVTVKGGFDIIIGNPPYVEYSKVRNSYSLSKFDTENCGNLYAFVMERAAKVLKENGYLGVIIPLASFSTSRMSSLQKLYMNNGITLFIGNFEATSNPTVLFVGVKVQLSTIIWQKKTAKKANIFTTKYLRSYTDERDTLFENIHYHNGLLINGYITRVNENIEIGILKKLFARQTNLALSFNGRQPLYYRNMGNFFFKLAFEKEPAYFKDGIQESSSTVSVLNAPTLNASRILIGTINSTLFYYYWIQFSDCYHLSKKDIGKFPLEISSVSEELQTQLAALAVEYSKELEACAVWQEENKQDGTHKKYRRYFPQPCKPLTDEIDRVLAVHYGFTDEELDFIINYDIKYRMGAELNAAD